VGESKTDAGRRRVKVRGALMEALGSVRDHREIVDQDAYVFPTRTGRRQYECKVREGTLGGAVKRANANLATKRLPPLPDRLAALVAGGKAHKGTKGAVVPIERARRRAA
jgi:hypothetical protein